MEPLPSAPQCFHPHCRRHGKHHPSRSSAMPTAFTHSLILNIALTLNILALKCLQIHTFCSGFFLQQLEPPLCTFYSTFSTSVPKMHPTICYTTENVVGLVEKQLVQAYTGHASGSITTSKCQPVVQLYALVHFLIRTFQSSYRKSQGSFTHNISVGLPRNEFQINY